MQRRCNLVSLPATVLACRVGQFLIPIDMICLSQTSSIFRSTFTKSVIYRYILFFIKQTLKNNGLLAEKFIEFLEFYGSSSIERPMMSGSILTAAFLGNSFQPNDVDVFYKNMNESSRRTSQNLRNYLKLYHLPVKRCSSYFKRNNYSLRVSEVFVPRDSVAPEEVKKKSFKIQMISVGGLGPGEKRDHLFLTLTEDDEDTEKKAAREGDKGEETCSVMCSLFECPEKKELPRHLFWENFCTSAFDMNINKIFFDGKQIIIPPSSLDETVHGLVSREAIALLRRKEMLSIPRYQKYLARGFHVQIQTPSNTLVFNPHSNPKTREPNEIKAFLERVYPRFPGRTRIGEWYGYFIERAYKLLVSLYDTDPMCATHYPEMVKLFHQNINGISFFNYQEFTDLLFFIHGVVF